jgi:diguanylate cyclase (GGDEF)-like protein
MNTSEQSSRGTAHVSDDAQGDREDRRHCTDFRQHIARTVAEGHEVYVMKKIILIVSIIWIALVSTSFMWNYLNVKEEQKIIAFQTARSFFNQILVSRTWNAIHGGVYVPITKDTQPNPYLNDPLRDIEVDKNLRLTKVNPAFMTRQIAEIAAKQKGIQFHITSLRPIRPENSPGALEKNALESFNKGIQEIGQIVKGEPNSTFFYMAPLQTEKACLKCHSRQGYKEGDIRGGISVTLPFIPEIPLMALIIGHSVIGLVGVLGIDIFGTKLNKAYESLKKQAVIDALTGIPNRRNFSDRILAEFNRTRRDKLPLSVIMSDIDNFKSYNDTYGHKSGDECLTKIAQVIELTLKRSNDFCARYGGEEFIIILPQTTLEGAISIAEKIRLNIFNLKIQHEKSPIAGIVSISLGVATTDTDMPMSHEELIKQADIALYVAKENGRNRVEVFNKL